MSNPNIPNISPTITLTRDDAVNLLLSSIAMEELGLAHVINAEGEKIQFALGTLPGITGTPATLAQVLDVNNSTQAMLDTILRQEMMLDFKLDAAANVPTLVGPTGPTGTTGAAGAVTSVNGQTGDVVLNAEHGVFPISNDEPQNRFLGTLTEPGVYSSNNPEGEGPRTVRQLQAILRCHTLPSGQFMSPVWATMSSSFIFPILPSSTAAARMEGLLTPPGFPSGPKGSRDQRVWELQV
ncbi:hypothetical protein MHI24_06775 [Paenibacillus sp. FSL K6-1096]|uniref:hypothetical protein n=1 Tax=Paenibacillus sp. FSL K6-1096 TaxID=2921460 RepID=UPI0030ED4960